MFPAATQDITKEMSGKNCYVTKRILSFQDITLTSPYITRLSQNGRESSKQEEDVFY